MAAENNYEEILEEVCEKINNIDSIKELDILNIKTSVESIESLINDAQSKVNFDQIKEKLENISFQVDSCNDTLLKNLYNDINTLKESTGNVGQYLENLQNVQNLALTSAEFEEYQKQQLDLALKTNENIYNELAALKENTKSADNSENIKNLQTQLSNLHNTLTNYIEQIVKKLETTSTTDEVVSIVTDLGNVHEKSIKQTNSIIKEMQQKLSDFHAEFKSKDFEKQITKISEIYDSLGIINAWIERVGYVNQAIENVYARLGESIDFDDVAEKVDIIYENIDALNNWTMKIDNVDNSVSDIQSKIASLGAFMDDTKNISTAINIIKNRMDSTFSEDVNFDDISNKLDIVYDNMSALNDWATKVDSISSTVNVLSEKIDNENVAEKIDSISSTVDVLSEKIDNENIVEKIDSISSSVSSISEKVEKLDDEIISSKIDIIYENIGLLNEWVGKIDGIAQKSEELDSKYNIANDNLNSKIDEITETLLQAGKIIEDVPNIKDKLEDLSGELHAITSSTKDDTDSYIYTLLDIESDFLKLHKFLDDKTQVTSNDINSLKERFSELNDDITSISIRTNKLILSADDANKEFKTYLDSFKNTIQALEEQRKDFNPELKFALIGEKVNEMNNLLQNTLNTVSNLNNAFIYLAEWVDATGSILNTMQNDIIEIKKSSTNTKQNKNPEFELSLKNDIHSIIQTVADLEDKFVNYTNEDFSELKSTITGVMVQLSTALTPDIESLNERINKLSEENNNKFTELENLMQEKINLQSKQIASLEEKIETLSNKFDKLIDVMSEDKTYEIKDVLNYIATQLTATNENITNQQNANNIIVELAEKVNSFDTNINKIVSYIEED